MIKREDVSIDKILWDAQFGVGKVIHVGDDCFLMEFAHCIHSNDVGVDLGGKFDHCRFYDYNKAYDMNALYLSYTPDRTIMDKVSMKLIPMEYLQSPQSAVVKTEDGIFATVFKDDEGRYVVEGVSSRDDNPCFLASEPIGWYPLDMFSDD